jgi:hypothetical protein
VGENPHIWYQGELHTEKVTVWCAVASNFITGPCFSEENYATVTINCDCYLNMLQNFFLPQLQNKAPYIVGNMWFQQDGSNCHTIQSVMAFLWQTFGNKIISWFSNIPRTQQSLDLTVPEVFLRGCLKEQVNRRHPHSRLQLLHGIQHDTEAITVNTLVAAMNNVIHQC